MEEPSAQKPWLSFSSLLSHSQKSQSETDSKKCDFLFFHPPTSSNREVFYWAPRFAVIMFVFTSSSLLLKGITLTFSPTEISDYSATWEESQKLKWLGKGCVGCVPPEILLTAMQHHTSLCEVESVIPVCSVDQACTVHGSQSRREAVGLLRWGRMGRGEKLTSLEELWDSRTWRSEAVLQGETAAAVRQVAKTPRVRCYHHSN